MPERATADRHLPVMLERVVELLAPALQMEGAVHVDATLGMGGHAEAVLERCPAARVIGIDRDTEALDLARERLARYGAGHRMDYATTRDPQELAAALVAQLDRPVDYRPVETDGAARTAAMLAELL